MRRRVFPFTRSFVSLILALTPTLGIAPGWAVTEIPAPADESVTVAGWTPVELPVMEVSSQRTIPDLQIQLQDQTETRPLDGPQTIVPTGQRFGEPRAPYIELTLTRF